MRNICLLWTSMLLGNYFVRADEVYFELLDENQIDEKSNFYNINLPNNSISWGNNKNAGSTLASSEDVFNITKGTSIFEEHESVSAEKMSNYDNFNDIPVFNFTSPFEEWEAPKNVLTLLSNNDIFKDIPDDYFEDSPNGMILTVKYTNSDANPWFRVFGILFAIIACAYGTYWRCTRKREVAENNDVQKPFIIVRKSEKI